MPGIRFIIFFVQLFLLLSKGYSQQVILNTSRIANFCKIWGFLKYYHPIVASGKYDWDNEFLKRTDQIESLTAEKEFSKYYIEWIKSLGTIPKCNTCRIENVKYFRSNFDLNWIADTIQFSNALCEELRYIKQNRNQGENYYVRPAAYIGNALFENEKPYIDSLFPSKEMRLLCLARYWNIIDYFYPYKYKTDENWNDVLIEMIPKFLNASDTTQYHLAILELIAKVNDSHARFGTDYTNKFIGLYWPPFGIKVIENKAVVIKFYDKELCQKNDIHIGDAIIKKDNEDIDNIIKKTERYMAASNTVTKLRNFQGILNGPNDSVLVTYERQGVTGKKYIYRYPYSLFKREVIIPDTIKILEHNIGYINMATLQKNQVNKILTELGQCHAIIFDIRNYPEFILYEVADILNDKKHEFAKFTQPDISYPGMFSYAEPGICGRRNKNSYKGRVILLFDETTQSRAEFTVMALRTAPNVTCIGSQTAGADGNVSMITLPGNFKTYISGLGVYYPDGRETQRIGIIPDIEVKPTIEGIRAGRDEVLEKAIEIAQRTDK
jgi:carboxyl-terminal processing protease